MGLLQLPEEIELVSFFSSLPERDQYDELTVSYKLVDQTSTRLEFSFNEATKTICTTLFKEKNIIESVFSEGLIKIEIDIKNKQNYLTALCRSGNYNLSLDLFVDPLIKICWKGQISG